jgi:hypothetical protein
MNKLFNLPLYNKLLAKVSPLADTNTNILLRFSLDTAFMS